VYVGVVSTADGSSATVAFTVVGAADHAVVELSSPLHAVGTTSPTAINARRESECMIVK
jgi:hypothetical protein